jgi:hypothetical protein
MGHIGEHDACALRFVRRGNAYFIHIKMLPYRARKKGRALSPERVRRETRKQALRALYVHLEALFDAEYFLPGQDVLFAYRETQPNLNLAMLKDTSSLPDRPLLTAPFEDSGDVIEGDYEEKRYAVFPKVAHPPECSVAILLSLTIAPSAICTARVPCGTS